MLGPLQALIGQVPIFGGMLQLLTVAKSSSKPMTPMTKEQMKNLVKEQMPPIPDGLKEKAQGIGQDVWSLIQTLPMILINVIFAMINVIWSKLKIITSIIPLGSMFPLNLIPTAITATPKLMQLMWTLPGYMTSIVEGTIKRKIAEAMALKAPATTVDPEFAKNLMMDIYQNDMTKRAEADKKLTYKSVLEDFYKNRAINMGYTMSQMDEILKNYLKINDGSNLNVSLFTDSGQDQELDSLSLMEQLGLKSEQDQSESGSQQDILGYDVENKGLGRETPSPKKFKTYLDEKCVTEAESKPDDENLTGDQTKMLEYYKAYKLKDILGEFYDKIHEQVEKKYGDPVVLKEPLPKSPIAVRKLQSSEKQKSDE